MVGVCEQNDEDPFLTLKKFKRLCVVTGPRPVNCLYGLFIQFVYTAALFFG